MRKGASEEKSSCLYPVVFLTTVLKRGQSYLLGRTHSPVSMRAYCESNTSGLFLYILFSFSPKEGELISLTSERINVLGPLNLILALQ